MENITLAFEGWASEKQIEVLNTTLKNMEGMTYQQADEVIYELLRKIKTCSLIKP